MTAGSSGGKSRTWATYVLAHRAILLSLLLLVPLAVRAQDVPIRLPPVLPEPTTANVISVAYVEPTGPPQHPVYPVTNVQPDDRRVRELEGLGPAPGTDSAEENEPGDEFISPGLLHGGPYSFQTSRISQGSNAFESWKVLDRRRARPARKKTRR